MKSFLSYKILPENKLILANFQYKVQTRDLKGLTLKYMEDSLYNPYYNLLMDFSDSLAIIFRLELHDYLDFFKKSVLLTSILRAAILFTSPNHEFLIKIYKAMAKLFKMDVEKFKEVNSASSWLGLPIKDFVPIDSHLMQIKYQTNVEL
jgi:hypothetical protein